MTLVSAFLTLDRLYNEFHFYSKTDIPTSLHDYAPQGSILPDQNRHAQSSHFDNNGTPLDQDIHQLYVRS